MDPIIVIISIISAIAGIISAIYAVVAYKRKSNEFIKPILMGLYNFENKKTFPLDPAYKNELEKLEGFISEKYSKYHGKDNVEELKCFLYCDKKLLPNANGFVFEKEEKDVASLFVINSKSDLELHKDVVIFKLCEPKEEIEKMKISEILILWENDNGKIKRTFRNRSYNYNYTRNPAILPYPFENHKSIYLLNFVVEHPFSEAGRLCDKQAELTYKQITFRFTFTTIQRNKIYYSIIFQPTSNRRSMELVKRKRILPITAKSKKGARKIINKFKEFLDNL